MELIVFFLGILAMSSPITIIIGLYKILFQKEDKAFGIQLLTYSVIVLIIGLGTCVAFNNNGF